MVAFRPRFSSERRLQRTPADIAAVVELDPRRYAIAMSMTNLFVALLAGCCFLSGCALQAGAGRPLTLHRLHADDLATLQAWRAQNPPDAKPPALANR